MGIGIRVIGGIWLSALLITAAFAYSEIQQERQRFLDDLRRRAALLGEPLKEAVEPAIRRQSLPRLTGLLKRFGRPERRVIVYDKFGTALAAAPETARPSSLPLATEAITTGTLVTGLQSIDGVKTYVYATPLQVDDENAGALVVLLDASHLGAAEIAVWQYNGVRFLVLALGMSLIVLVVLRITVTRPVAEIAEWTRMLKAGKPVPAPSVPDVNLFGPLELEVSRLAGHLYRAQAAAEQEAALRVQGESMWTEERLKQFVRLRLGSDNLYVVSNREPVSHVHSGSGIVTLSPASGVVTALEPVVRACGGVWVAHGSGNADREVTDDHGRVGLPENDPFYTLRRVWLTKEEEAGYYYGFANEGLWPLCHIVHARPLFRDSDWEHYRTVNHKFAAALLDEMEGKPEPLVLIQDYHFALLPKLVKAARPDARVSIFWHIPWPNFEAFGICPWSQPILEGMLAADLIGFHTQYHCNNFLESVERTLEGRVDWEHFTVTRGQHTTQVKPFPISVAPDFVEDPPVVSRQEVLAGLGVDAEFIGVGVERLDYTKGLPERFLALQRFFELHPQYRERLVFVQLGTASRSEIPRYQELQEQVRRTVDAVNRALQTRRWRPIVYLQRHYNRREIWPFYRHADFCMVTSLHDGMNLVAKEFVSVRDDGGGALILSRFTGAARELTDALLVNPYDLNETAEAIRTALEMSPTERAARMVRMHQWVREYNVYRWAGLLLGELSRVRPAERDTPADTTAA